MMGDFGYELDITKFTEEERREVKEQIELYKKIRPTMQRGSFYRLMTPFAGTKNETAWQFVSQDGSRVVLLYFKTLAEPAAPIRLLKLTELDPEAEYEIIEYLPAKRTSMDFGGEPAMDIKGKRFYGDELMYSGLTVEKIDTDFAAYCWVFDKK